MSQCMGLSDELEEETQWTEQNLMYVLLEQYAHVEVVVPEEQEQELRFQRLRVMLLLYRFKLLYLSSYMSFQGNVSLGPENELVLGPSESVDLYIGCWEVQLAVHGICMYHISCYPDVRGGDWVTVP